MSDGSANGDFGRAGVLQTVVRKVIGPVFRRLFDLEINGIDNLPTNGPAIIAANHTSVLDSFIVPAVLPRRVTYVGKAEYLDDWKTRHIFPALGMIPIDRSGGDAAKAALDMAAQVLGDGEFFAIYPEGTRSRTGVLYKGRTGVARLAMRTGAPIVPVGLQGVREIQPPDAPMPSFFKPATISFGMPIQPADYGDADDDPLVFRAMTDSLMFRIRELSGQDYENRYAPSAAELAAEAAEPAIDVRRDPSLDPAVDARRKPAVAEARPDPVAEAPLAERRTATSLLAGAPLPSA